jgi:hypothetical protein
MVLEPEAIPHLHHNRLGTYEFTLQLGFSILQQHLQNLKEVCVSAVRQNVPGMVRLKCTTLHNGKIVDVLLLTGEHDYGQSCKNGTNKFNTSTLQERVVSAAHCA